MLKATEPLKGHGVEKYILWGEEIDFKAFAFAYKTFLFPQETLRSLAKLLEFQKFLVGTYTFYKLTLSFSRTANIL